MLIDTDGRRQRTKGSLTRSRRTVPRSFRIDEKALEILESEAERQSISPSSLVNRLIIGYVEYGRIADQMGALSMSRKTLIEILNSIPDETLIPSAERAGKSAAPAYVGAMRGHLSLQSIRYLMSVLSKHAKLFEFNEIDDIEGLHWTLIHDLGLKWSLFLAHYFSEAFASANVKVRFDVSDRNVIFWLQ